MKKLLLLPFFVFIVGFSVFSQETTKSTKLQDHERHELKFNALYMIFFCGYEGTYEYLLNEDSGVGMSLFLPIEKNFYDDINYFVSPYYRLYFGNKFASGFFLEGFGLLNNSKNYGLKFFDNQGNLIREDVFNETNFALGIGLGTKWLTKRGLLGEVNFGMGRNLFSPSAFSDDFIGKISVTVGFQF